MSEPKLVTVDGKLMEMVTTDSVFREEMWTGEDGTQHWTVRDKDGTRTVNITLADRLMEQEKQRHDLDKMYDAGLDDVDGAAVWLQVRSAE